MRPGRRPIHPHVHLGRLHSAEREQASFTMLYRSLLIIADLFTPYPPSAAFFYYYFTRLACFRVHSTRVSILLLPSLLINSWFNMLTHIPDKKIKYKSESTYAAHRIFSFLFAFQLKIKFFIFASFRLPPSQTSKRLMIYEDKSLFLLRILSPVCISLSLTESVV